MEKAEFKTDNFLLACYLLSEGCSLLSLDKTNVKRALFVFEESQKRIELTDQFLSYKALVEPNKLYASQRNLKQMLYSNR